MFKRNFIGKLDLVKANQKKVPLLLHIGGFFVFSTEFFKNVQKKEFLTPNYLSLIVGKRITSRICG